MAIGLSKSKLLAFRQCPKRLWLEVVRPELGADGDSAKQRFAAGHRVGELARAQYPDGVLIAHDNDLASALRETSERLCDKPRKVLFEATFERQGLLVRTDLLIPVKNGWHLVEVKSSTKIKDYHLEDAAIQSWVLQHAWLPIRNASLQLVDSQWTYPGGNDYSGLLQVASVGRDIGLLEYEVPRWLKRAKNVIDGTEPKIKMGKHCNDPFPCGFQDYCQSLAKPVKYPVSWLPRLGKKAAAFATEGIVDMRKVPAADLTDKQYRVLKATLRDEIYFEPLSNEELKQFSGTRYYLDFETISFAVPIWAGTRPYQQVPFQYHCHIDAPDSAIAWTMFLDVSGNDPSRHFAKALVRLLGRKGPIIAYNAGFEKRIIKDLAARFEDLAPKLNKLLDRVVDLLPFVVKHYYHPDMQGSWSLKAVLPTIAPDLAYSNLGEVADGASAQSAYLEAIHNDTTLDRRMDLEQALVNYCRRDTEAMLRILTYLCEPQYMDDMTATTGGLLKIPMGRSSASVDPR